MMTFLRTLLITAISLITIPASLNGDISLPKLISDGMVLQRDSKINIWGWAAPGEKITIRFAGRTYHSVTDKEGNWKVPLSALKAGGPYTMDISGKNKISISDILIGDVWFCSGQSNMVLPMDRVKEKFPEEIAAANYPEIRNFFIPTISDATTVHKDLPPARWISASPQDVLNFGAASYFFAKQIYLKYKVPIGIINSSVGGTPAEAWISEDGLKGIQPYEDRIAKLKDTAFVNSVPRLARKQRNESMAVPRQVTTDKGTTGPKTWFDSSYIPEDWHKFWLPGYWEDQGVKGLNGIVWFRKEIDVPESMAGKETKLFVGRIVDADMTYVNGRQVGNVTYQYPPRRYNLPAGLLKPGRNIIVVKVTSTAGKGGFVPDKPYYLTDSRDTIDLRGQWLYKVGQVFDPVPAPSVQTITMQNEPTGLYNTMVAPEINYTIRGFLWYQGETNSGRPKEYQQLLTALINDWRSKWQQGALPFLYVQLPNFMEVKYSPSESQWAELRFSQLKTLSVPNTAMAVTIDAGEWNDIHPLQKKVVGERLALAARKLSYGENDIVFSGPVIESAKLKEGRVILSFSNTGSGLLINRGGDPEFFSVAGTDRRFYWADAKLEDGKIVLKCSMVPEPAFVRYAWADNPEWANLYNAEGLPASPFEAEVIK
jgi:sialate O-acetylesterase